MDKYRIGLHVIDYKNKRVGKIVNIVNGLYVLNWAGFKEVAMLDQDSIKALYLLDIF